MKNSNFPRQPNQYRIITDMNMLTQGAEELLSFIQKYGYTWNVTNAQYGALMGRDRRHIRRYVSELIDKGYIRCKKENRRNGRGYANSYEIIKLYNPNDFDPSQEDNQ